MAIRIASIIFFLIIAACALGAWGVAHTMNNPFIAMGAHNIQITLVNSGKQQISYTLDESANGWQTALVTRIRGQGWHLSGNRYAWGDTEDYIPTYERMTYLWPLEIHEEAQLIGDRYSALIIIERHVRIVWD